MAESVNYQQCNEIEARREKRRRDWGSPLRTFTSGFLLFCSDISHAPSTIQKGAASSLHACVSILEGLSKRLGLGTSPFSLIRIRLIWLGYP